MSILIKGMEMPKNCWDCYFQDCGNCRLNAHKVVDKCIIEDRRDEDCPLVHVPAHGDLIDRNNLLMIINQIKGQAEFPEIFVFDAIDHAIKSRRAIISGEEGEI